MTQTRRILLNVLATYGRSLFSMACGIFTGRWVLEALGSTSYGVFGVVGTVIGMVTVVNNMLSSSVSRYFAFEIGKAKAAVDKAAALEECRGWFNTALAIHTIIPLTLVSIGYPLGVWAIRNYFAIPMEMVETSVWVFRFALITSFVGMTSVPFKSLYVANQMIAELTIYSFFQTLANVVFAWILLSYSGDRLLFNSFYLMLIAVVPQLIIATRAFWVFEECRVRPQMMFNRSRYGHLFSFAGWQVVGWLGLTLRFQGLAALCNKALGLQFNSSVAVSNNVSQHAMTFSYALNGAFSPAITNSAGAGDAKIFQALVIRSCKFGSLLCAIFVIPLGLEIHYVMHLWLKEVPPLAEPLCAISLVTLLIERMTAGLSSAISAKGDIKLSEICCGIIWAASLGFGYFFVVVCKMSVLGIGLAILICTILQDIKNVILARYIVGIPIRRWIFSFAVPFTLIALVSFCLGGSMRFVMDESLIRLILSVVISVGCQILLGYYGLFDNEERLFIKQKVIFRFRNMHLN